MAATTTTRRLLAGEIVAGPFFVLAFLLEGATRAGYDPFRDPISSLAIGPDGWIQSLDALPRTLHGQLHQFFSSFFFLGLPVATFVFARYFFKEHKRSWATYSLLSGVGALVFFLLTSLSIVAGMNPNNLQAC